MRQNRVHLMPPMSNFYARICVKATPSSNTSVLSITERSVRRQSAVRTMLADHREYQYTKLALAGATAKKKPPKDFSRSGFFSTIRLKGAT